MGTLPTWLSTRPTYIAKERYHGGYLQCHHHDFPSKRLRLHRRVQTIHQDLSGQTTYENHVGPFQTIGQTCQVICSSDFGHKSCRRKKHAMHQYSLTGPSADIVAAASPCNATAPTSRSRTCQTVDNEGQSVILLLLPPLLFPHELQRHRKQSTYPTSCTCITIRTPIGRDVMCVHPRESVRNRWPSKRCHHPRVLGFWTKAKLQRCRMRIFTKAPKGGKATSADAMTFRLSPGVSQCNATGGQAHDATITHEPPSIPTNASEPHLARTQSDISQPLHRYIHGQLASTMISKEGWQPHHPYML